MFLDYFLKMKGVKDFLESSTIHGLVYISTSKRKLFKIFWVSVVISSFLLASYLISNSFDDWKRNPVITTIQTFPIKALHFPRYEFSFSKE